MTLPSVDAEILNRLLIGASPDGVVAIDPSSTILLANAALGRMFGHPEGTLVGRNLEVIIPPRLREHHRAGVARYLTTGVRRLDWSGSRAFGVRADGTEFPIEISFGESVLRGERTFLGFIRDVSERDRLEAQLRQSQKLEAIGQLAGGVAHDFNNLLTVILAHARFLLDSLPKGTVELGDAEAIDAAGQRAAALTSQLLAFSRRQVLVPAQVSLGEVVAKLEPMLLRLIGEHIVFVTSTRATNDQVLADRGQLEQVITNLAINARDAMPQGGTLTIEVEDATADVVALVGALPGDYVLLRVTDTGAGMDHATQSRAFEPFFTTKETGTGTGLGLATVFGIVSQSEGHVAIDSALGRGATFTVLLPRRDVTAPVAAQAVLVAAADPPGPVAKPPHTATILLVEDEATVRSVARRILERAGYVVLEARHGADAKLVASQHRGAIDLLLTDVVMPELNGADLGLWFEQAHPNGRVVFMSGYAEKDPRLALANHSLSFVPKPFTASALILAVRSALRSTPLDDR